MSAKLINTDAVCRVMRQLGSEFRTKQLSTHPEMVRAHSALAGQRNYHSWVGRCLAAYVDDARPVDVPANKHGALWRNGLCAAATAGQEGPAAAAPTGRQARPQGTRAVRPGHVASLEYMGTPEFLRVKALFEAEPEIGGVYFRPGDRKVTVVDLHPGALKPRVGVGADPNLRVGATEQEVAPSIPERIQHLRVVRARQQKASLENQFEASLIRDAQANQLRLPGFPERLRFVHSQWRIDRPGGSGQQFTDLAAVDLREKRLVLIELKREADASALPQVQEYARWFEAHWDELGEFFLRLARVMGSLYDCGELAELASLEVCPDGIAAWPAGRTTEVVGLEALDALRAAAPPRMHDDDSAGGIDLGPQSPSDDPFSALMRRHQSWYRAAVLGVGYGSGPTRHSKRRYGNMLTPADAEAGLNFLTPVIHRLARERVAESTGAIEPYRLLHNMLSSQPMCFNLFGELAADLALARQLLDGLGGLDVARVHAVRFEYAPEPASEYLDDRTAFDAFVDYERRDGTHAFLGIETKLTESFSPKHYDRPSYRRWMNTDRSPFRPHVDTQVSDVVHNQLWRDHLLALALRDHTGSPYQSGALMLVRHPRDTSCARVTAGYQQLLDDREGTFIDMPLDRLVDHWKHHAPREHGEGWLAAFEERYLALDRGENQGGGASR